MRQTRLITLILGMISISQLSYGYLAIHETGDILPPNQYSLGLNQQIITDPGTYGTLTATASMGLTDSSQLTMRLGTGYTDYHLIAQYKWIPYPDFGNQPAIGGIFGIELARPDGINETGFYAGPLVSKKFATDQGTFDSYMAVPLYLVNFGGDLRMTGQLVFGTVWQSPWFEKLLFTGEMGLRINDYSFTSISFGAIIQFSSEEGLIIR